jgi:hypothetical protein
MDFIKEEHSKMSKRRKAVICRKINSGIVLVNSLLKKLRRRMKAFIKNGRSIAMWKMMSQSRKLS